MCIEMLSVTTSQKLGPAVNNYIHSMELSLKHQGICFMHLCLLTSNSQTHSYLVFFFLSNVLWYSAIIYEPQF